MQSTQWRSIDQFKKNPNVYHTGVGGQLISGLSGGRQYTAALATDPKTVVAESASNTEGCFVYLMYNSWPAHGTGGMQREHNDLRQVRPMTSNPNNGDKTKINMLNGHAWIATATHHFIHTCKTYAMHEQWADAIECTLMQVLLDNINQSIVIIIYPLRCLPERRENWCLDGNQAK